jgi:hypothetical protein
MIQRVWTMAAVLAGVIFASAPAVAQDTLAGLGRVQGYTGVVFDTTRERYDILVDASRPEDPAANRYRTIQAAYAAAKPGTREAPTVIGLLPDVYRLNGTPDQSGLIITKDNITLLGLTRDRRDVVLADNRGNKQGAANNGFSMMVEADGFSMINLTILNHANLDYDYPGDPSKSLKKRSDVITQAVAIQMIGDRHVYSHVAFLSRLDTLFNRTSRSYFKNVYLEGTDDYLGVPGASVWEDSEINFIEGGGIILAGNTTFIRTRFRATKPMSFYKTNLAPVALIESTFPDGQVAWFGWRAPAFVSEQSLTWKSKTESGRPVDIVDSVVGEPRRTFSREMTEAELAAFNPWNRLRWNAQGVDDGWDPAGARAKYESAGVLPWRLTLANGISRIRTGEPPVEITATIRPAGSTRRIRWTTASPHVTLSAAEGERITVVGANATETPQVAEIRASADNGFYSTAWVTVDPAYRPAPTLAAAPVIRAAGQGRARLDYDLALGNGRTDQSLVTWFVCADDACARRERLAVSRGDEPLREIALTPPLAGRRIVAEVEPKHDLSRPGPARRSAAFLVPSPSAPAASAVLDARSLPDTSATDRFSGEWRLTGNWASVPPLDPGAPFGLRPTGPESLDSALLYVGRPRAGDMDVIVVLNSDKYEGQGFSIAGGPEDDNPKRADIVFKYDPETRTGYALRFWRSIRSATAVEFQLFRIENGKGTPIGDRQLTGVLKPVTTLRIEVRGTRATVRGANTTDAETLSLSADIDANGFGGAGFYWAAAGRGGSAVLHDFRIDYR